MNTVIQLMRAHRSIRSFKPDPLPDGYLEAIIEAAQWASTSAYRQMYSIIAIRDPQTKKTLTELCGSQPWIEQCPVFLAFCMDLNRLNDACRIHGKQAHTTSTEVFMSAVVDVALVMQNTALAAESLGLGIVMIGTLRNYPRRATQLLGLPKGVFGVAGMCVGYPNEAPAQRPRLPLAEVLHYEHYSSQGRAERLAQYDEAVRAAEVYRGKDGRLRTWTELMARQASATPGHERLTLREVLEELGFALE